jgi:hypothetical protein
MRSAVAALAFTAALFTGLPVAADEEPAVPKEPAETPAPDAADAAKTTPRRRVLVELFTSQG